MTAGSSRRRGLLARLRYRFDRGLSRSPWVLVGWLGGLTLAIVLVAAALIAAFHLKIHHGEDTAFPESFWQALLRVMEPTSLAEDEGWPLRLVSLVVTLSGIFVASALIGLIASSLDQRIMGLRKGRGVVLEAGHILVLGWSERLFSVVSELVEANANQRRAAVVILAGQDKTHMEDQIRDRIGPAGRTEIICRTGDPASGADLELVNDTGARAVVVLAEDGSDGDAAAISAALMVLHRDPERRGVVVEVRDPRTARDLAVATAGRVVTVEADDVIAKVTAQACYQAGMGAVYQELLSFGGDEIYLAPAAPVAGRSFGEALLGYDTSSLIGRVTAAGTVELAPAMATVFAEGDQVMAISADDDTVVFGGFRPDPAPGPPAAVNGARAPSHLLVVGWSGLGALVLRELQTFHDRPDVVDVLVDEALAGAADEVVADAGWPGLQWRAAADERAELAEMMAAQAYDHVLVLGYRGRLSRAQADAHTLLTLATVRRIPSSPSRSTGPPRVVAEVLDSRNVDIARATGADDLVVSDRLSSLLMAQLAERPLMSQVFAELFDPVGASIELRPAGGYVAGPGPFAAVVAAARDEGEVAIGYRRAGGEVVVNPPKHATVDLGSGDQVIVVTRPA